MTCQHRNIWIGARKGRICTCNIDIPGCNTTLRLYLERKARIVAKQDIPIIANNWVFDTDEVARRAGAFGNSKATATGKVSIPREIAIGDDCSVTAALERRFRMIQCKNINAFYGLNGEIASRMSHKRIFAAVANQYVIVSQ